MATAVSPKTLPVSIIVVGANPQALPDLREDPSFLFVDYPEEARERIPFSNDVRYVVLDRRIRPHERDEIMSVAQQAIPYAEIIPVVPPKTFRDTIDSLQKGDGKVATIVEYVQPTGDALPPGVTMEDGVLSIPWRLIRRFDDNPRLFFPPDGLQLLAASIRMVGQVTPGLVRRLEGDPEFAYQLVDGERRWLACKIANCNYHAVLTKVRNSAEHFAKSAIANFGGEPHTPLEAARALNKVRTLQKLSLRQLAQMFTRSTGWVEQHLDLLKLEPEVQELMLPRGSKKKGLKLAVALKLKKYPRDFQIRVGTEIADRGFRVARANAFIRSEAVKAGLITIKKQRSPRKDFRLLESYLERTLDSANLFQEMPDAVFKEMFAYRVSSTRDAVAKKIDRCATTLLKLKKRVEEAKTLYD